MDEKDAVAVQLISPATTPGSTNDEERCLTVSISKRDENFLNRKWDAAIWNLAPCFMTVVSISQIFIRSFASVVNHKPNFHFQDKVEKLRAKDYALSPELLHVLTLLLADEKISKLLRFEPAVRWQVWRFVSYMLLHLGRIHLVLNVVIQWLLAVPLEVEQGSLRTIVVYLGGGLFGAVGACILQPQPMIGASAGIYALLISHLAHLYLNIHFIKYRKFRVFAVCVLAMSDIAFYAFHSKTAGHPPISLGAHASGGLSGALLGLVVYKGPEDDTKTSKRVVKWCAFITLALLLIISIVVITVLPPKFFTR